MIVYRSDKSGFMQDVNRGEIDLIIQDNFRNILHRKTTEKERDSWWNSLNFMLNVLNDSEIPSNTGVAIECQIPQTSKRIDFILSGYDHELRENVVIVELKQWKKAELTVKDGIVKTALGKGLHETSHPSYQAWSYAAALNDFSETVQERSIHLQPCAFLHNYEEDEVIRHPFYSEYLEKAPVFLKRDQLKLQQFIKKFVRSGDNGAIMFRIDEGRIRPSKQLSESLSSMMKGNKEFILLDEQKLIYENALFLTEQAQFGGKKVYIIEGGPGTGKSVVAINLLTEITRKSLLTQYVTKNAAPRAVYQRKLAGTLSKTRFNALFQSSGTYVDTARNSFDALIVDETHRLNAKSGMFQNKGENQLHEIIKAAKCSIFFIDENQQVTLKDIGTKEEIVRHARKENAEVHEAILSSQFRCNGSDGYLAFLDNLLQIKETAVTSIKELEYDFRIFDNPSELRDLIYEKNKEKNSARLVAGYCWDWISKQNPKLKDIVFPGTDFAMKWNLNEDTMLWIMKPDSVEEVGCIHTCQGLELDYVGVIIGMDMICRNSEILVDPSKRSKMDSSIKGYKTLLKQNEFEAKNRIKQLIKNTYRTLMTRGMKGCYVYCEDKELKEWFQNNLI